jgi:hypothetical protein
LITYVAYLAGSSFTKAAEKFTAALVDSFFSDLLIY